MGLLKKRFLIEEKIGLNSVNGMFLDRKANPNESPKLTKKLTNPMIPTPKIPQNNIVLLTT